MGHGVTDILRSIKSKLGTKKGADAQKARFPSVFVSFRNCTGIIITCNTVLWTFIVPAEIEEDSYEILHIPDKPLIPPNLQPTVNVFASLIDPKHANALVRKLNQIAPLENLRHVKRVHKKRLGEGKIQLSVILCLASEDDDQSECMPSNIIDLMKSYQLSAFIKKVCKYAAMSKEEWEEQCKLWPTSFHPPTYNIEGITGFSEEDSKSVSSFMRLAIELAKSGAEHVVNAAVIVDPSVKQVIAIASDQICSCSSPSNKNSGEKGYLTQLENNSHVFENEVENHETLHLNGSSDESKQLYSGVSCLYPLQWVKRQLHTCSCDWHPLRHAAFVAIEYSAARDRRLFPGSGYTVDNSIAMDNLQSSSEDSQAKRQKTTTSIDDQEMDDEANGHHSETDRPYLCTGCDIYLIWEPCMMCAMALVHQRIRRIFYAFPNSTAGALGSVHRLHGEKSLNHHYAVFRVLFPEETLNR